MELPFAPRRLGVILGTLLLTASPQAGAGIGRTPGFATVSGDGEAEYTIPLALPPGTNGMTPVLSLEYRHRTRGGLLGIGWSIGGLSQIARCPKTYAQDGAARTAAFFQERFCLDGQRLVVLNQLAYDAPGAEYRTEIESYARIRAVPGASSGPGYFVVEAADGRIYEYGATPDSRIDGKASTTSVPARIWALNRIRDRSGNVIDYEYYEETTGAGYRIKGIRYNANPAAGVTESHRVAFNYENRPNNEVDAGYVAGTPVREIVRLDRVEVLYNDAVMRRYDLTYEPALSAGGRSRLASVRECRAGGLDCLAATTFEWQEPTPGFASPTTVVAATPLSNAFNPWTIADLNGDGRKDYVWAGGATSSTATIRYRLGGEQGVFGPEVNSGISSPRGPGRPFDSNGDGRMDFLMALPSGHFGVARGSPTGLAAPQSTGISYPAAPVDFRGLDLNADGLGDIAWSEVTDPTSATDLVVRARYARASGGYSEPALLYSQVQWTGYPTYQGGRFLGSPADTHGDGGADLLMDEVFAIVGISRLGHLTSPFPSVPHDGITLDFNDDECSDFAYRHMAGTLRIRVSKCGTGLSDLELLGPALTGLGAIHAHDWNDDGRDDVLLVGVTNWHVAISHGDKLGPVADTGVPHGGGTAVTGLDVDGDGLQDLITRVGNEFRLRLRNGVKGDLMVLAKDGFGVTARFAYGPLTDAAIHTQGTGAVFPEQDVQSPEHVVSKLTETDGGGRGWLKSTGFRYEGLRRNLRGRGSAGFRKQVLTDLTYERLNTEITRHQEFPYTRLPESITVRQKSGKSVSVASFQWSALSGGSLLQRQFPYPSKTTVRRYEAGGAYDGAEITRLVRSIAAIDAASGLVTDETTTITEIGGGADAGSSASFRTHHASVFNDTTNWCLGRTQAIQLTASHTLAGGTAITRNAGQTWDGLKCRPTQHRIEPDSQWQVTHDLAYEKFGNLSSEKVTGAGMPARTMAIAWDARGQFPIRIANPLSQLVRMTWDAANGLMLTRTDPNGLVSRWNYDAFDRPERETQPDGTSTHWFREGCKSGCDARGKYRLTQQDRDKLGAVHASSSVEINQHERGYRLKLQQPGGGHAVSTVDSDERGLATRRFLPHWSGGSPPGYWQFNYDVLGRQTGAQLTGSGAVERSIELQYDGLSATQTDPLGHVTTGTRTAWGRMSQAVDAVGGTTGYEHDAFGNLLRVRDALNNTVATIGYNPRGMKLTHGDIDMGAWTWTRNALGETTALRDAKGQVVRFEYDPLGRITKRTAPDGAETWAWGMNAVKKDIGRLTGVTGPGYSESFTYDSVGRPVTRTITADASYRFDYGYDALGLLATITYPATSAGNPFKIRYNYDAGRVAGIRNGFAPGEPYWTLNAEDAAGNPLDETFGSGIRVISGFNPVGGMLEYRQSGASGKPAAQNLAYDWDANGNLKRREDLDRNLIEEFRYDTLDRLDDSRRNGIVNLALDYDALGNIRRKSDVCGGTAACYSYHASRKHAVVSAGGVNYAYDANGNMTIRGGAAIGWTSGNLPSSIAQSNGNNSQFSYGPSGNRWKQVAKHGSVSETTIYAGELLEKVTRAGVTSWRHYVLAPTGTTAVQLRHDDGSPPTMRYLTQDHLGSTDRILDAAGNVVVAESFAPFGRRRGADWTGAPGASETGKISAVTRDGFTGHEHLDNLDLIHMNGRVYDPHLGRFLSADPFVTLPLDGQGLNRYSYTLNNPLSFIDPSGFDPLPCMEASSGACAQVTVVGVKWADWIRYMGGGAGQVASASERDPCGQESDAYTCAMQGRQFVSPASIVLTVGSKPDSTLSRGRLDAVQGAAARIANLAISNSPVAMLFGADPDFQWFREPDSEGGRAGATVGNVGYLIGGFGGIIRKGGSELLSSTPSQFARSLQGFGKYPGVDRFKDITLKKGTIVYSGFPGQTAFYTTASSLRRSANSAESLFRGLQLQKHRDLGYRTRVAAYEVMADTPAAFGLAIANTKHGAGWSPQVVVPSFESSLRFLEDFPLGP